MDYDNTLNLPAAEFFANLSDLIKSGVTFQATYCNDGTITIRFTGGY